MIPGGSVLGSIGTAPSLRSQLSGSAWARQDCPRYARRCAVLTRPARSRAQQLPERRRSLSRLLGRTVSLAVARLVAGNWDLIWGQPDDSAFAPHSDWIAVSFMALKRITDGRAERALNSIQITGSLDGSGARIRNGHACNSFSDSHASASATIVAAPKARDATRCGLTTSALS